MSNLLRASLLRLKKDKTFWMCVLFSVGWAVCLTLFAYSNVVRYEAGVTIDDCIFKIYQFVGILAAVFCSLYIGTEYSDGTIRNKLVVGRSRTAVYMSNAVTAVAVNVIFTLLYMAVTLILGIPLLGLSAVEPARLLILFATGTMMTVAISSVCCMLSMLNQNKALVAVISIIGVFALIMVSALIISRLNAPEFYEDVISLDNAGNPGIENIANSEYLRGTARTVYTVIANFLPTGQGIFLSAMEADSPWWMMCYSLIITVVANVAGVFCFRRKNLK